VVNAHLFPLAAYDSHTNHHLCSGKSEMFSFALPAAGGTGNLLSQPQLTCVLDVTGSLVQFLDCVDTSTMDPAGETTIKNKFIPLAKVHPNLEEGGYATLLSVSELRIVSGQRLERPRQRWEDNIKMDLQEVGGGCGDWMELAQDRDSWQALVNTVRNLRVPKMWGISCVAAEPFSFSRRTLLHGVSKYVSK
jgi:hypothetical protein